MRTLGLILAFLFVFPAAGIGQDYFSYHASVRESESFLLDQNWDGALEQYLKLEKSYEFLFAKDLKIALQLAYRTGDSASFHRFSEKAFARGWKWKKVKKELKMNSDFAAGMGRELKSIAKKTEQAPFPNSEVRNQVKRLFVQDQWQALGALFIFSSEKQDRYAERKFAPKAKERVEEIRKIMDSVGYPGEMLIGNRNWAMTILSHYNSISVDFSKNDTIYPMMREQLRKELGKGRISPFEFALIENWHRSVGSAREAESYGILEGEVSEDSIPSVDVNRLAVGLATVGNYNQLLQLQSESGIRLFFGEGWGNNSPIGIKKSRPSNAERDFEQIRN